MRHRPLCQERNLAGAIAVGPGVAVMALVAVSSEPDANFVLPGVLTSMVVFIVVVTALVIRNRVRQGV